MIAGPLLALLTGLLTLGASARTPDAPHAAGGTCTQRQPAFHVTDDPAEVRRQQAFERSGAPVTRPGFHNRPTPATPTIHAASHGSVVVYYRPGLPEEQLRPLRALAAAAAATKAPVIVTPRRQRDALIALGLGHQLTCSAADAAQTARVRGFAAAIYPSLTS